MKQPHLREARFTRSLLSALLFYVGSIASYSCLKSKVEMGDGMNEEFALRVKFVSGKNYVVPRFVCLCLVVIKQVLTLVWTTEVVGMGIVYKSQKEKNPRSKWQVLCWKRLDPMQIK